MMKKFSVRILVILISFCIWSYHVYATTEENTTKNVTAQKSVTEEKPTETKKNETMYVQERCNIRKSYSVDSDRVGGLDVGTEVTVVAEYSNGWYKINYDGGEAYIKAGILRSTKPEIQENSEETEPENSEEQVAVEQPAEQNTEEQQEQNQLEKASPVATEVPEESNDEVSIEDAELINEIGVLPEVGKNIADYLYIGVIILTIIFVIYVKYKS